MSEVPLSVGSGGRKVPTSARSGRGRWTTLGVLLLFLAGCGRNIEQDIPTKVTIDSTPEQGARILMDGVECGVTPKTFENLQPGWKEILLKKENYKRTPDRIEVKDGTEQTYLIHMERLKGYLSLDSQPAGADIYVDGETLLGKTPLERAPLPTGPHTYELRLDNYYPVAETLEVKEDFQYNFVHRLKPIEATLSVFSLPTGSTIWLNNQVQLSKTPAQFKLAPGSYLVTVHTKGFVQEETRVDLKPNDKITLTLELKQGRVPQGMVLVPAGPFIMGEDGRSPDESPRREVVLDAFCIDKYEVTNAQFKAVFPSHTYPEAQDDFPVTGVSWNQAVRYAQTIGKRLPTEAEWEKAARGPKGNEYPWGMDFDPAVCNTAERDVGGPMRVGGFPAGVSPYGLMDAAGNVYEWVQDWYEAYPGNRVITRDYGQIYRVLRGGSFTTGKFHARCARRHFDRMDAARADYGFRCAMDVDAEGGR